MVSGAVRSGTLNASFPRRTTRADPRGLLDPEPRPRTRTRGARTADLGLLGSGPRRQGRRLPRCPARNPAFRPDSRDLLDDVRLRPYADHVDTAGADRLDYLDRGKPLPSTAARWSDRVRRGDRRSRGGDLRHSANSPLSGDMALDCRLGNELRRVLLSELLGIQPSSGGR
jgi:hypothetical protein